MATAAGRSAFQPSPRWHTCARVRVHVYIAHAHAFRVRACALWQVLQQGMNAGELGPSTIVGSAAFNLMVITAVCSACARRNPSSHAASARTAAHRRPSALVPRPSPRAISMCVVARCHRRTAVSASTPTVVRACVRVRGAVVCIPAGETRTLRDLGVFLTTATCTRHTSFPLAASVLAGSCMRCGAGRWLPGASGGACSSCERGCCGAPRWTRARWSGRSTAGTEQRLTGRDSGARTRTLLGSGRATAAPADGRDAPSTTTAGATPTLRVPPPFAPRRFAGRVHLVVHNGDCELARAHHDCRGRHHVRVAGLLDCARVHRGQVLAEKAGECEDQVDHGDQGHQGVRGLGIAQAGGRRPRQRIGRRDEVCAPGRLQAQVVLSA
jgi:hypothetical protein